MKKIRLLGIFLCLILSLSLLVSCDNDVNDQPKEPAKQAESFYDYFDTVSVVISYEGDDSAVFRSNCNEVSQLLGEYHKLFDIYYEYAGINNLKTINKNAGKEPVKVDPKLIDFLLYAKEIYTLTNGATNVAMGSVLKLWHDARVDSIDDPENAYIPTKEELEDAAEHTNIEDLIINVEESTVYIADPLMSLDVGAVAKGYAVEKAAALLISRGVTSYVLNVGGNIRAIGEKTAGKGWITGITNPDKSSDESFACRVIIKNISLVTSGDYERYFVCNGVKYHHIIDAETNMPANRFSSVSIFTADSGLADSLSTALFCMSYEDGLALINKIGGIDVIWIYTDGTIRATDGIVFAENE